MTYYFTQQQLAAFTEHLYLSEKSAATIEKYNRDLRAFAYFVNGREVDKALVLEYKNSLLESYTVTSANSMLAALNHFFRYCEWHELIVKRFRVQREAYSVRKDLVKDLGMRFLR